MNELSQREKEVLELIAKGFCNKDIADKLFVTEKTIKFHNTNIFRKLGVTNRTQATLKYLERNEHVGQQEVP